MATNEEAAYILQLQEMNQQLRERLRVAEEALAYIAQNTTDGWSGCLVDELLTKIREVKR